MEEKQYISRVQMDNGVLYQIKDAEARELIEQLFSDELILDGGTAPIDQTEN